MYIIFVMSIIFEMALFYILPPKHILTKNAFFTFLLIFFTAAYIIGVIDRRFFQPKKPKNNNSRCNDITKFMSLAYSCSKQKDYDRAIYFYTKVIELDPFAIDAYNELGTVYIDKGDFEFAISSLKKAINIDIKYAIAYYNIGEASEKKGDLENALFFYRKSVELNFKHPDAYNGKGTQFAEKYLSELQQNLDIIKKSPLNINSVNINKIYSNHNQNQSKKQENRTMNKSIISCKSLPLFPAIGRITGRKFLKSTEITENGVFFDSSKIDTELLEFGISRSKLGMVIVTASSQSSGKYHIALTAGTGKLLLSMLRIFAKKNDYDPLVNRVDNFLNQDKYIANSELTDFVKKIKNEFELISGIDSTPSGYQLQLPELKYLWDFITNYRTKLDLRNENFIKQESVTYHQLLGELTDRQKQAALTDEDNTLVVAGAGAGKTKLIINKVQYLLKKGTYQPQEILVLAFNNKIKKEITEKFNKINISIDVHTFHSLGNLVVRQIYEKKPAITKYEENDLLLPQFVEDQINELLEKGKISAADLADSFYEFKSPYEFENIGEYEDYIKSRKLVNLQGDKVKSYEELYISNYLIKNCIDFKYENYYEIDTSEKQYRKYMPDFTIYGKSADKSKELKIYLEHFAINIDTNGNETSFFGDKYIKDMQWKRALHKQYGTILIENHSNNFKHGNWQNNIKDQLQNHGILFNKTLDDQALLEKLKEHSYISQYAKLMATFLKHYKGNNHSLTELNTQANDKKDNRAISFFKTFKLVYEKYAAALLKDNEIDFSDMINKAAENISDTSIKFKLIIVDEFQDISTARAQLLKELQKLDSHVHLFCVGDDWQSIYRFAGGNITLMSNFKEEFGYTKRIDLDKTFRYNSAINDLSIAFIQRNPQQLKKEVNVSDEKILAVPMIYIASTARTSINQVVERIEQEYHDDKNLKIKTLLILARYNYQLDNLDVKPKFLKLLKQEKTNTVGMSIHASKGLEADFVIVLDNNLDSFPSTIQDDSILEYVLPQGDNFKHAEERRLFYVAVTRAKEKVYLMTDEKKPSCFIDELLKEECYNVLKFEDEEYLNISCPKCKTGYLSRVKWQKADRYFFKCNHNYHCCRNESDLINACPECNFGYIDPQKHFCSNPECITNKPNSKVEIMKCPKCDGYLVKLTNNSTGQPFYGCVNFRVSGCKGAKTIRT